MVLLAASVSVALATPPVSWNASCTARDEPTLWWAIALPAPPPAPPDFACDRLFLDGVDCNLVIAAGKLYRTEETHLGRPVWEARYLPYGDVPALVRFLDRFDQGVVFVPKVPPTKPGQPAPIAPDARALDRDALFIRYMQQRERSSHQTEGVTLHLWACPDDTFQPPEVELYDQGMSVRRHTGKYVIR